MRFISIIFAFLCCTNIFAQHLHTHDHIDETTFNCFTVIAGKDATTDGSVLMGHNEDDWGEQMLSMYIVPHRHFHNGDLLRLEGNAPIPQPEHAAKHFWVQMVAQDFADLYLNEHGVAVVSNRCDSREDRKDYTEGGIGYALRRSVAERATSARHGVELIGELVEKYGYNATGRTYCLSDKNEGWAVSVVRGRHWVAQRIQDNQVMVMPNYYTIDKINLEDSENFLGSDVVGYAIERGWYNPETDGEFSFREVYSNPATLNSSNNKGRKWGAMRLLSPTKYDVEDEFPFEFVPKEKINVQNIMSVLSDHFEGTDMDRVKETHPGEPHSMRGTICNLGTQSTTIFQLRDYPVNVGAIMWTAMYSACRQVFLPWYFGTDEFPEGYASYPTAEEALDNHFTVKKGFRETWPDAIYWDFLDYSKKFGENYVVNMEEYGDDLEKLQNDVFSDFAKFDKQMTSSPEKATPEKLGKFTRKHHDKLVKYVNKVL